MPPESDLLRILRLSCILAAETAKAAPDLDSTEVFEKMSDAVREETIGLPRGMRDWSVVEWFGVDDVLA